MKKVVLIEDDPVLRESTAELLGLSDYEVKTAANGKKGVAVVNEFMPDVVICDIMMPELDGYEVFEALSKNDRTKAIPFIFLSAKTERKDIRKGMELGADDYLTKPFEESELIGAIESRLAKMAILEDSKKGSEISDTPSRTQIKTVHQLKNFIDDNGQELTYNLGDTVYREGMYPSKIYLVLSGVIKTHVLDEMGKELITGIYKPDDFFSLPAIVKEIPYKETATVIERTTLICLPKDKLKTILENNPGLAIELIKLLSDDIAEAKEQLLEMAYGSVRRKTASTLLKFAEKLQTDPDGNLHILRSDLANVAGMATETLIRALSSFKKEGLIHIDNRNIKILDITKLGRMQ